MFPLAKANRWSKASIPANFPVVSNSHFCNSSMTPDGERIYFTVRNAEKEWNDLSTRCEIFVTKKAHGLVATGTPAGLREPERHDGYTPVRRTRKRPGTDCSILLPTAKAGGGMDIWYVVRDLGLEGNDFTFPVNAGPVVNTLGQMKLRPGLMAKAATCILRSATDMLLLADLIFFARKVLK